MKNIEDHEPPYMRCFECEYKDTKCHVADKYQRLPREKYRGALGQCIKVGGRGQ